MIPSDTATDFDDHAVVYDVDVGPSPIARGTPFVVVAGVLLWAYASEFSWFWEIWSSDPNYSHGYFVIPVALWILWRRLKDTEEDSRARGSWPWYPGWPLLVALLVARAFFHQRGYRWSDAATFVPVIACLTLTLGGWGLLRRVWPAVVFLLFMMPLPNKVNDKLAQPRQSIKTHSRVWLNVIYVGKEPILVAEACNGLSMLMTLAATLAAAMFLFSIPLWMRAILALSIVPIALASNILRIFATAWCFQKFGVETGGKLAHDAAGWLMMPLALAMALFEIKLLSWLIVEEDQDLPPLLLGRPIAVGSASRARLSLSKPASSAPPGTTSGPDRGSGSVAEEPGG